MSKRERQIYRQAYKKGQKRGQKDMLTILFGELVIGMMFALMFGQAFMF